MQIHGTTHVHGPHGINAPHTIHRGHAATRTPENGSVDRVEISAAAEAAARAAETGQVRQELVDNIRARIAAGTYETSGKLEAALERMLDEIA